MTVPTMQEAERLLHESCQDTPQGREAKQHLQALYDAHPYLKGDLEWWMAVQEEFEKAAGFATDGRK